MLALGYLAANPALASLVPKEITQGFLPTEARVVAISGRSVSRDKYLWGDIAEQLGKPKDFVEFYKGAPQAPLKVIGTVSSDAKAKLARHAGCDHVINYSSEDFVAEALAFTAGNGVAAVFNSVGADTFRGR